MTNIPKTIYLQIGKECSTDEDFKDLAEVSWCAEKIFENDIEYVLKEKEEDLKESEKELEERTERNIVLIDAFCEHLKSENIIIPESLVLSFFNA
jgi:hypothetical protein